MLPIVNNMVKFPVFKKLTFWACSGEKIDNKHNKLKDANMLDDDKYSGEI